MKYPAYIQNDIIRWSHVAPGCLVINCPGCGFEHTIPVAGKNPFGGNVHEFNGDFKSPTITPAIHIKYGRGYECKFFILCGRIHFHKESTHKYSNGSESLPALESDTITLEQSLCR